MRVLIIDICVYFCVDISASLCMYTFAGKLLLPVQNIEANACPQNANSVFYQICSHTPVPTYLSLTSHVPATQNSDHQEASRIGLPLQLGSPGYMNALLQSLYHSVPLLHGPQRTGCWSMADVGSNPAVSDCYQFPKFRGKYPF